MNTPSKFVVLNIISCHAKHKPNVIKMLIFLLQKSMNKEIRDIEAHIESEGGESTELSNLKAALQKEEVSVVSKKEESKVLLKLLDVVNGMVDMAERFWDKTRQVKDKKDELQVNHHIVSYFTLTYFLHKDRSPIN